MYEDLMIGDEVVVHEIQGQKRLKVYNARIEGIYEHFINVRHRNGYLISILKQDLGKKVLIRVRERENEKMAEKLTKEVLAEEMKTMTWEEIAKKHGFKMPGPVKGLAVRYGLIEGTGVYREKKNKKQQKVEKVEEVLDVRKSNFLKPTSFVGQLGKRYEIKDNLIRIHDSVAMQAIDIEKDKFEIFFNEISELLKYIEEE
ncbi:hypothetical protein THYS13_07490 [Thermoanaerobacter sp. YS13]|uniref:hypothetical protein n=1 Tax=Thermoanaerobacter sp. YS13 TaxID=1511746 RepID=UPI0005749107|nr:hypothetical protein [Thermoanaerobacter sp. YS13]KHO62686.1 hypothetical protein THYS13_07490 [Thermoanaerobacter sp. YS13]